MELLQQLMESFQAEGLEMDMIAEDGVEMLATSFFYPEVPTDSEGEPVSPVLGITIAKDHQIAPLGSRQILTLSAQVYYTEGDDNCDQVCRLAAFVNPMLQLGSLALNSYYPDPGWYLAYRYDAIFDPRSPQTALDNIRDAVHAFDYYMADIYPRLVRVVKGETTADEESAAMMG